MVVLTIIAGFSSCLHNKWLARPRLPVDGAPLMSLMLRLAMFPRRQWYQIPCITQVSCTWLFARHLPMMACRREWLSKGFVIPFKALRSSKICRHHAISGTYISLFVMVAQQSTQFNVTFL